MDRMQSFNHKSKVFEVLEMIAFEKVALESNFLKLADYFNHKMILRTNFTGFVRISARQNFVYTCVEVCLIPKKNKFFFLFFFFCLTKKNHLCQDMSKTFALQSDILFLLYLELRRIVINLTCNEFNLLQFILCECLIAMRLVARHTCYLD